MTLPSAPASPLQRAALSLHGLGREDRDWILGSLPGEQGEKLRDLLRELQELGIPAQGVPLRYWFPADSTAQHHLPSLSPDAASELARLLAREPARVREVLRAAEPSWSAGLPLHGGESPATAPISTPAHSPALQAAVLAAVRSRIEAIAARSAAGRQTLWKRVSVRLRHLRRR